MHFLTEIPIVELVLDKKHGVDLKEDQATYESLREAADKNLQLV